MDEGLATLRTAFSRAGRDPTGIDATAFGLGPDPRQAETMLELGFNRLVFAVPPAEHGKVMALLDRYAAVMEGLR